MGGTRAAAGRHTSRRQRTREPKTNRVGGGRRPCEGHAQTGAPQPLLQMFLMVSRRAPPRAPRSNVQTRAKTGKNGKSNSAENTNNIGRRPGTNGNRERAPAARPPAPLGGGPADRATTEERRRARAAYKQVGGRGVGARPIAGEAPRTYYTSTPQTPQTRASRKQTGGAGREAGRRSTNFKIWQFSAGFRQKFNGFWPVFGNFFSTIFYYFDGSAFLNYGAGRG